MSVYDVTALGELLVDFTADGTASAQGNLLFEANPGGAPCNVLAMLQRLGRRTAFIGKVGGDAFGAMLAGALRERGSVPIGCKPTSARRRRWRSCRPPRTASGAFVYGSPGADRLLRASEVDPAPIRQSRILHFGSLSMSFPAAEEATRTAVAYAGQAGVLRSFDPNLRLPLWDSPAAAREKIEFGLRHCDILKISDDELEFVTGERDADKGLARLWTRCDAGLVCVTMGRRGSRAWYRTLGRARRLFRRSGRRYHRRRRYVHRLSAGRRAGARDKRL
ncbi:MAG: PfkB family carbohydrate kinase [Acutalibacteraceae bacterium]